MPRQSATAPHCFISSSRQSSLQSLVYTARPTPLAVLRTQWKWAAFSQFYLTFDRLFTQNDISLAEIESDLVNDTRSVLPRIMQRLLIVLSHDRKISLSNWQSALRKQYRRRKPSANPIGNEPLRDEHECLKIDLACANEEEGFQGKCVSYNEVLNDLQKETIAINPDQDADGRSAFLPQSENKCDYVLADQMQGEPELKVEQEESKDWLDLPMLDKLESMHLLIEWQFQNPMKLRAIMRSDDVNASWRIEPIGFDAKRCAYWLIGGNRLWIQRPIPKSRPSKANGTTSPFKRKLPVIAPKAASKIIHGQLVTESVPFKRRRLSEDEGAEKIKSGRAAKVRANLKLDQHAMALAEYQRQIKDASLHENGKSKGSTAKMEKNAGSHTIESTRAARASARARVKGTDGDGWQTVPDEWLTSMPWRNNEKKIEQMRDRQEHNSQHVLEGPVGSRSGLDEEKVQKTGLESDRSDISELTEFTEDCAHEIGAHSGRREEGRNDRVDHAALWEDATFRTLCIKEFKESSCGSLDGFVEWETICTTLIEWEQIASRFEKATHYAERALHKFLVNDLIPVITQELMEIERSKTGTISLPQIKRSHRLLLRQSVREEAEASARKQAEEEERTSRAKRQEARIKREEEERDRREVAREMRRREREQKGERERIQKELARTGFKRNNKKLTKSNSRTPTREDWELDCDICLSCGINPRNEVPVVSCGYCSKWQHIPCHDIADEKVGRPRRNWDDVEFICRSCQERQSIAPTVLNVCHEDHQVQTTIQPHFHLAPSSPRAPAAQRNIESNSDQKAHPVTMNGSDSMMYRKNYHQSNRSQQINKAPISFSLSQAHQQGLSDVRSIPYSADDVQTYGQAAVLNQYSHQIPIPVMNGSGPRPSQHLQTSFQPCGWNNLISLPTHCEDDRSLSPDTLHMNDTAVENSFSPTQLSSYREQVLSPPQKNPTQTISGWIHDDSFLKSNGSERISHVWYHSRSRHP